MEPYICTVLVLFVSEFLLQNTTLLCAMNGIHDSWQISGNDKCYMEITKATVILDVFNMTATKLTADVVRRLRHVDIGTSSLPSLPW